MIKKSPSRRVFEVVNYTLFTLFGITILFPFINTIAISLSSFRAITLMEVTLWPVGFNVYSYQEIFKNSQFMRSFMNTVGLTIFNTTLVIFIALLGSYAIASKYFVGKKILMIYLLITFYFSGGLIPTYLLVTRLGLRDSYFAMILPQITSVYYIIIFRNIMARLPQSLLESAEIDGATHPTVLFRIVFPLVLPTVAAFVVFSAVAYWNEWFSCMIYISDRKKWTLQFQLREILMSARLADTGRPSLVPEGETLHPENIKMAALMVTIIPIIIVYPFLQKYFVHGVLVGAVKG